MSDMAAQNGALPPGVMVPVDPGAVTNALMQAVLTAARLGAGAQVPGEVEQAAKAALAYAQAIVVLDPNLTATGEPLDQQAMLEALRHGNAMELESLKGANALEQARARAAAPSPKKRLTSKSGADGSRTYQLEG